ncbi:MAG TPA: TipAS antibiotic-recognition domain-containing protein, partial [Blastocatellia bacterium]|nr:TipAS antibiotic-recognition domain-containing protein [Blastocatellia bacterium]
ELGEAIRFQLKLLAEKREQLDLAVEALERVEGLLSAGHEPDWEFFAKIVEVISMQNKMEWMQQYYSPEAREAIAERAKLWSPELQAQISGQWAELIADVETAIREGVNPASERGQALGARSAALVAGFTGGNPAITEGLNKLYADQGNWPSDFNKPYSDEVGAFFCAAMAAGKVSQG